jgi:2',3'-cyclic-nucleotide 2'-phosphodiesterase/3'-nucleotidase
MHSLARAILAVIPLGMVAAAASRPVGAPREMTLLVAATTDVHGHLTGWDYYANRVDTARGLARTATIVAEIRDLLIAEVERRKRISPTDYFQRNWSIVPAAAIPPAYAATHHSRP